MEIDELQVRGAGGRIRRIGDDAHSFVDRTASAMQSGTQGNEGFAAVSTLRQVIEYLNAETKNMATKVQSTGDKVGVAADNHSRNESRQQSGFSRLLQVLTGGG